MIRVYRRYKEYAYGWDIRYSTFEEFEEKTLWYRWYVFYWTHLIKYLDNRPWEIEIVENYKKSIDNK